ncbi:SCP2 sterol-binding domain-containing protein [Acidithiobacillus caldus]|nr:SCP2 sterol-binding domain-containing protein [Acidithiobacillus caldus]WMT48082.1 MAG: SCP2 sterol-binding domain-containing protein [Acidithiobacillus caldus]
MDQYTEVGFMRKPAILRDRERRASMIKRTVCLALLGLGMAASTAACASDAPEFMSPGWAKDLCTAWNGNATLTEKLAGAWIKNDGKQGYKVMEISDSSLKGVEPVQLEIAPKDGKAMCIYGGAVKVKKLNYNYDYKMWATTHDWYHMGSPMMAMMFGRLNFKGPKMEAMENMGPFAEFLKLVAETPATVPPAS